MRKMIFVIALAVIGAGQSKADPCVVGTAASYVALGATGCTINGAWTISNFMYTNLGTSGPTALQQQITPISVGGVGFSDVPLVPWSTSTGIADGEIQYVISFTGSIANIFQSITGSVAPTSSAAFDNITEDYCPGGTTLPPGGCTGGVKVLSSNLAGSNTTTSNSASFAGVSSVAVLKDVSANATGFPGGTATITGFTNVFNIPTPEPSTVVLLGMGLAGLAFVAGRKLRELHPRNPLFLKA